MKSSSFSYIFPSRRRKWLKWHKWLGLSFSLFLILFVVSGIILNHREGVSHLSVSRSLLPPSYRFRNWNLGSAKGTLSIASDSVLLYGENGIWLMDGKRTKIVDFNEGMASGAEYRSILNVGKTRSGDLFAITPYKVYEKRAGERCWSDQSAYVKPSDRWTDIAMKGDTLVLQSRSLIYWSLPPYRHFHSVVLTAPSDTVLNRYTYRTIWMLHSGELFGIAGRLFVDFIGLLILFLCITGCMQVFFPKWLRKRRRQKKEDVHMRRWFSLSARLHSKWGIAIIVFLLLLTLTGMCLRPPLLIPLAKLRHRPIPLTVERTSNLWSDQLRMIRYDRFRDEWLLQTPYGFFVTKNFESAPRRIASAPPVGFMGTNVLRQEDAEHWIAGSFSGLYRWNRVKGDCIDLFTRRPYQRPKRMGMPDFRHAVSGYCATPGFRPVVFDYYRGAEGLLQENEMSTSGNTSASLITSFPQMSFPANEGRMSLWRLALEVHTGRIYTFLPTIVVQLFIFLAGCWMLGILLSGFFISRRKHRGKHLLVRKG